MRNNLMINPSDRHRQFVSISHFLRIFDYYYYYSEDMLHLIAHFTYVFS